MNKLGVIHHVSRSKKLILRTKIRVKTGIQVLDEELKPIGRIFDVFGPAKYPYVSVEPIIDELESYVGQSLYIIRKDKKGIGNEEVEG